ncbi:polysaccharide biosynthesis tyrosine autokinase [Gordonia hongkongensis]|uniref:polysaccharide biosynthesis tyrosine autokinase n=1 Tax=Gordonia hongkongensis TaxID=1701090 RepID=UPI001FF8E4F4|nr:polysaccharide biosynthesis tyrosine autokinase [Gordonia hongkongensis]UPG69208.1 protein tyrosine kinase [Gordonia hongkongensis]
MFVPLSDYVRVIVRYWWALVAGAVTFGLIGFGYGMFVQSTEYVSSARLFVTAEGGTSVGESYQNNLFAEGRVNSYAQVAVSEQVATRASAALDGAISPADLRARTTALPVDDTVILTISVTGPSPQRAQSYASAIAQQTVEVVEELETSRRGGTPAASAVLYDEPGLPARVSPPWLPWTALGVVGGLVVGVLTALLLGWRRRGTVEDVSAAVDSAHHPVLATVTHRADAADGPAGLGTADPDADSLRGAHNLIRFLGAQRQPDGLAPRVLGFVGVGKDSEAGSVAARFAATISATGNSVLLVDGDLTGHGITGATSSSDHGLSTVLTGSAGSVDPFVKRGDLTVLPAGPVPPEPGALVSGPAVAGVFDDLRSRFDYIVIAGPAIVSSPGAIVFAALADATVVVVRSGAATRKSLRETVETIELVGAVAGTILVGGTASRSRADKAAPAADDAAPHVGTDAERGAPSSAGIRAEVYRHTRDGRVASPIGVPDDGAGR